MSLKDLDINPPEGKFPIGTRQFGTNHVLLENTETGWKIIVDPLDRTIPADLRAGSFHRPFSKALLDFAALPADQKATFGIDGKVTREGWLPGGVYVSADGTQTETSKVSEAETALMNAVLLFSELIGGKR